MNTKTKRKLQDAQALNTPIPMAATPFLLGDEASKDALMQELQSAVVGDPDDMPTEETIYGSKAYTDDALGRRRVVRWYLGSKYLDNYAGQTWHGEEQSATWPYYSTEIPQGTPFPFVYAEKKTHFNGTPFTPRIIFEPGYLESTGREPKAGTSFGEPKGFPSVSQLWTTDCIHFEVPGRLSAGTEVRISFKLKLAGNCPAKWELCRRVEDPYVHYSHLKYIDGATYYDAEQGYAIMPVSAQFKLPAAVEKLRVGLIVEDGASQVDGGTSALPAIVATQFYAETVEDMPTIEIVPPSFYRLPDGGIPREDLSEGVRESLAKADAAKTEATNLFEGLRSEMELGYVPRRGDTSIDGWLIPRGIMNADVGFPGGSKSAFVVAPAFNVPIGNVPLHDHATIIRGALNYLETWAQSTPHRGNVTYIIPMDYAGDGSCVGQIITMVNDSWSISSCCGILMTSEDVAGIGGVEGGDIIPFNISAGRLHIGGNLLGTVTNSLHLGGVGWREYVQRAELTSELTTISDDLDTTNCRVSTLRSEVDTLNGSGEGSVSSTVAKAIAEVVASAPEDLDTLKEIADYIAADKTGAADLVSKISALTEECESLRVYIQALEQKITIIEGNTPKSEQYIDLG